MSRTPVPNTYSAYFKTGLISILWALGAIVILLVLGRTGELIFSTWFQTCIAFSAFIGGHLSGGTYFGRVIDLWSQLKTRWSRELKGTVLAISAAVATAVILTVLRSAGHFFLGGIGEIVANFIGAIGCVVGTVGAMAGFGNRLSSGREPKAIFAGTVLGLGTSLAIWFTGNAAITAVAGVTTFLTGGLALPIWAMGALFVVGYTGANVSSFDYHARTWRYLKYVKAKYIDRDPAALEAIEKDFHQYRGSTIGVVAGLIMATIVIVTIGVFVTQPWFLAIPVGLGIYYICTSLFAGICGRLGRELDEFIAKNLTTGPPAYQREANAIELQPIKLQNTALCTLPKTAPVIEVLSEMTRADTPVLPPPVSPIHVDIPAFEPLSPPPTNLALVDTPKSLPITEDRDICKPEPSPATTLIRAQSSYEILKSLPKIKSSCSKFFEQNQYEDGTIKPTPESPKIESPAAQDLPLPGLFAHSTLFSCHADLRKPGFEEEPCIALVN
jgi:MFS family permease